MQQDASMAGLALSDLNFSDIYIRMDVKAPSHYRIGPNEQGLAGCARVQPKYDEQIALLRSLIDKEPGRVGTITLDEMRLRYCRAGTVGSEIWVAIRRIPLLPPDLTRLGLDQEAVKMIQSWGVRRGLVAIGGATGAGKTTTAVSAFCEFIDKHNAVGVAIEDPAEYLLQGRVGNRGFCLQFEVNDEDGWKQAVMDALRSRPRYLLLGEIRTPEAANQALIASQSGHLVLTTAHGGSVEETLGTILGYAEVKIGEVAARRLLANNLVAAVYQRLGRYGPNLSVAAPTVGTPRHQDQVRNAIAEGKIEQLRNHVRDYVAQKG